MTVDASMLHTAPDERLSFATLLPFCAPYLVLTGKGQKTREKGGLPPGTQVFPDLAAVTDSLLRQPEAPSTGV